MLRTVLLSLVLGSASWAAPAAPVAKGPSPAPTRILLDCSVNIQQGTRTMEFQPSLVTLDGTTAAVETTTPEGEPGFYLEITPRVRTSRLMSLDVRTAPDAPARRLLVRTGDETELGFGGDAAVRVKIRTTVQPEFGAF